MSSKRHHSQRSPFNAKRIKKIETDHSLSQADETQKNDPSLPQTTMNSTKCPKDGTDLQAQGPTEQPVPPTKTMTVTLKGDHRTFVLRYRERSILFEALTSLPAVREKIRTQKGTEVLVRGTEGIKGYISLGMPLRCFPKNCHLEITLTPCGSGQNKQIHEFVGCSEDSSKCVKFYIHVVSKEQRRIVAFSNICRESCKLSIYAVKEETIRQALCRDGRLLPFLESGDWKLIENRDTILENSQVVGGVADRVIVVEVEERNLTMPSTMENSESEKRKPTPLAEGTVERVTSLKRESEEIKANLKKNVEPSKEKTLLSKFYTTDFGKLIQNCTPITQHRLLARLANSVGRIEWNKNGRGGYATCFVYFRSYIFTCGHLLRTIAGQGVELHNCASIISQHAKVIFDYENSPRENNRYFSIDPLFFVSNEKLDYGVLRLKENGQVPLGLYQEIASDTLDGSIHIIGHLKGELKRSAAGLVIPQSQHEKEYQKCIQAKKAKGFHSNHVFIANNFLAITNNPDLIIYHSCLSFGSSGSPVFNSSGALVAMHLGCIYRNGESVIGCGRSLNSILCDISQTEAGRHWFNELKTFSSLDCPGEDAEMADETQKNDPSLPQTTMNSTKCSKDGTDHKAQGPTEQLVSSTKTMNVTLKGDHRAHVVKYSEGGSLHEALTSLQAVREKIETQKGTEMLVRGTAGIEGYINLGMPLSCFPENCHLEITFAPRGSERKKESQEPVGRSRMSSKCVKFYVHAVGKELRRIVKSKRFHRKGCKLCIYGFKEETIRQALCRDGRLRPFLESGDWKLIENGDTILENTQLVGDLEGRVFEVELEKRKLTRVNMAENSESEKRNPTPLAEGMGEQHPSLKGESEEIKANFTKNVDVEVSKEIMLSESCKTDFGKLTQNCTPVTEHRLLACLANSVGRIEWNKNGLCGSTTCFVFFGWCIFTCRNVLKMIVGERVGGERVGLHKWASIISRHAKVTFDYENSSGENNRYFSIDPLFLVTSVGRPYAVLRLKEEGQAPLELHLRYGAVPLNGSIHIIGHSKGEIKHSVAGIVIPQSQREEECRKCLQARKAEGCQSDDMFLSKSFQMLVNNPDVIIYHIPLSFVSLGSPVFNSSGALVAMHFGPICRNEKSAIGIAVSLKSIIRDILQTKVGRDWFVEIWTLLRSSSGKKM